MNSVIWVKNYRIEFKNGANVRTVKAFHCSGVVKFDDSLHEP